MECANVYLNTIIVMLLALNTNDILSYWAAGWRYTKQLCLVNFKQHDQQKHASLTGRGWFLRVVGRCLLRQPQLGWAQLS
jgi:hypothetical protein